MDPEKPRSAAEALVIKLNHEALVEAPHRKADKAGRAQQHQVGPHHAREIEPEPLPVKWRIEDSLP